MLDALYQQLAQLAAERRPRHRGRRGAFRVPRVEPLERRQLLAVAGIELLDPATVNGTTGEKPQSKVWQQDQHWWASWSDSNGSFVRRLDGTTWTPDLKISDDTYARADVVNQGDVAHVLLKRTNTLELASIELVPGNPPRYQPWSARPATVDIPIDPETATIAVDSADRMWLAYDNGSQIEVLYSDAPYAVWSGPVVLASGVNDDDIAAVTALPNGSIGVMWSDQSTQRFGFRVHVDGTNPGAWSANEVPASQSVLPVGNGMADDHLNMAVASDGTLYAAVKTEYNTAGYTQIALLVRRPDGNWDPMVEVDTEGTRPIVQLNEAGHSLLVMYRIDAQRPIVYRECSTISLACGEQTVLMDSPTSLNNVSSTKQNHTDELVVLASGDGVLSSIRLITGDSVNQPPFVNAGADQVAVINTPIHLTGQATDDGRPNPPAAVTVAWSVVSGPAAVVFADPAAADTTATFSQAGIYVLKLTAHDGELSGADEMVVTVSDGRNPVIASFQDGIFPSSDYLGTRDAYINSQSQTTNYGSAVELAMDGSPDLAALLRWDVSSIPAGSTVTGAQLTLNVTGRSPELYEIYRARRPWTESEATWLQASSGWNWDAAGAQGIGDRDSTVLGQVSLNGTGQATFDLNADGIAAVQAWVDSPGTNYGLVLQDYDQNANGLEFNSREAAIAGNRPRLTLSYLPADQQGNLAPTVQAGPDQNAIIGTPLPLDATVTDDARPDPPAAVTVAWSMVSGPAAVAFANPAAIDTTATFSQTGTYVLRLTADDGALSSSDDVVVTVTDGREPVTLSFQDGLFPTIEYSGTRDIYINSQSQTTNYGSAVELAMDGSPDLAALLRWDLSSIPAGSTVTGAQLTLNVTGKSPELYEIYRARRPWTESEASWLQASSGWNWDAAGAQGIGDRDSTVLGQVSLNGTGQATFDLNADGIAAVQAWIDSPGTNYGLVLQDYDQNTNGLEFSSREAAIAGNRPRLTLSYLPADQQGNLTPTVQAGPDQSVRIDTPLPLDATVTDDGRPDPPAAVTVAWNVISGPAAVAFANPAAVDTTATFSQAGTYVLRLTADDGALSSSDDVVVTVSDGTEPVTVSFQDDGQYLGTSDAMIVAESADMNFGSATTLSFDGAPDLATLLRWDTSTLAPGSTVESAAITLNVTNRTDNTYPLYEVLRPWVEGQVTWRQSAAGTAWEAPGAVGASDRAAAVLGTITAPTVQSVTIQLTAAGVAAVQRWIDNPGANHGVIIQDYALSDNGADVSSREAATASLRPRLSISYRPAPETQDAPLTAFSAESESQDQPTAYRTTSIAHSPATPIVADETTVTETTATDEPTLVGAPMVIGQPTVEMTIAGTAAEGEGQAEDRADAPTTAAGPRSARGDALPRRQRSFFPTDSATERESEEDALAIRDHLFASLELGL